jgi:hypothetical protein
MAYSHAPSPTCRPASYTAAHDLVRATKGSPSDHKCISCGGIAQEWALMPGSPSEATQGYGPHGKQALQPQPSRLRGHVPQ